MKKIGVFGGTFNPIHNGHISMAKQIGIQLGLDFILVIPTKISPHKLESSLINSMHRYEMCKIACLEDEMLKASDVEINREGKSYTVDTLRELSIKYNNSKLYFIMGSDSFFTIMNWAGFDEIKKLAILCTTPRNINEKKQLLEMNVLLLNEGAQTRVLDIPVLDISSTKIRERVSKGLSVNNMVPCGINHYIKEHKLYVQYEHCSNILNKLL